jgi:DNA-binding IclR family transcriptional regulator
MTSQALATPIDRAELNELMPGDERLTATEIARRLGVPLDIAWEAIRLAVDAGYLDRDEFGSYAPWCAWPRFSL